MWSPDRRTAFAAALALVAMAGCGFTPALAPGGPGGALTGRGLDVTAPATFEGRAFLTRVEERLGRPAPGAPRLAVELKMEEQGLAVTATRDITRYNVRGRARWRLLEADGRQLAAGEVQAFTAYSATDSGVATYTARRDARRRLAIILADRVIARLMAEGQPW